MSASERLRALDRELHATPLNYRRAQAIVDLRSALPLIADVVEAAEGWREIGEDVYLRLPKFAQAHYKPIHEDETPTLERCFRLTALTALREHLEGPTGPVGHETC